MVVGENCSGKKIFANIFFSTDDDAKIGYVCKKYKCRFFLMSKFVFLLHFSRENVGVCCVLLIQKKKKKKNDSKRV